MGNLVFVVLGWLCLALGAIGIFLPLLPTTPFILLAAYFFSKGSAKLHQWLLSNRRMGPLIHQWETYGVIAPFPKWIASIGILLLFGYTLGFVDVPILVKVIVATIGIAVLTFILSRPSYPEDRKSSDFQ